MNEPYQLNILFERSFLKIKVHVSVCFDHQMGTPIVDNDLSKHMTIYSKFVDSLIIINQSLTHLPDDFFDWFPNLRSVDFSENKLRSLPPSFGNSRKLFVVS